MNKTLSLDGISETTQILFKSLRIPSILLLIITFVAITNCFAVDLVDAKDGLLGSNGMLFKKFIYCGATGV